MYIYIYIYIMWYICQPGCRRKPRGGSPGRRLAGQKRDGGHQARASGQFSPWKCHQHMGKYGKIWENLGNNMGKSGKIWEITWEDLGKYMGNNGNFWDDHKILLGTTPWKIYITILQIWDWERKINGPVLGDSPMETARLMIISHQSWKVWIYYKMILGDDEIFELPSSMWKKWCPTQWTHV